MSSSNDLINNTQKYLLNELISLHPDDQKILSQYPFNEQIYLENLLRLKEKTQTNILQGLSSIKETDVIEPPAPQTIEATHAREHGLQALQEGKLAVVVLAGGMATRFGGGVKGLFEISPDRSLLDLHYQRINPFGSLILMTSHATHQALQEWSLNRDKTLMFTQGLAPRATSQGELWRDQTGRISLAATGHGDLIDCLRSSGTLQILLQQGVETLLMLNVDNVAATPDPLIYGTHLLGNATLSVEVTHRESHDRGGLTLRHNGVPRIVEDFLVPPDFDTSQVHWLNTNTLWIQIKDIDRSFDFSWVTAHKTIGTPPHEQNVIQFERLIGELSAFVPTRFLTVNRQGIRGRFFPIKTPQDVAPALDWLNLYERKK